MYFLALALALLTSPVLAADDYAFILKGRGNVFWKVIEQGIREAAKEQNINALIYNTDDDQQPEAQLNICETVIERKPKVIVLGAATKAVGIECYKKAQAAGIIVADIDGNVLPADASAAGVTLAFSVASDNYKIGQLAAQHVKQISVSPNPKVLVIEGLPGNIVSQKRSTGFTDTIKKLLPQAQIVGVYASNWDRYKAMTITTDVLQREPALDYIFSASDVMTMGIIEVLRTAGKTEQVKVLSVDAMADARKAVIAGRIEADVAQLPYLMGKRAVEKAIDVEGGKLTEAEEVTPTPVLTQAILQAGTDSVLKYVK